MQDLHEIPKIRDSLSYLYIQHARIDQHQQAIAIHKLDQQNQHTITPVPVASLSLLLLGPGTSITHAAIRTLARSNCLVAWTGEHAVRFYAFGTGATRSAANLLRQAALASNPKTRLQVVERMYRKRLGPLPPGLTLQQIRGREGIRVRQAYQRASQATGVPWHGRTYRKNKWNEADPVNRALSAANACLYGITHAAILATGHSPAIGFIHTGHQLSFVYDIADLYKVEITIPAAFRAAAEGEHQIERRARTICRDLFHSTRLLQRIADDIADCLDIKNPQIRSISRDLPDFDHHTPPPPPLWDPNGPIPGGQNYAPTPQKENQPWSSSSSNESPHPSAENSPDGHSNHTQASSSAPCPPWSENTSGKKSTPDSATEQQSASTPQTQNKDSPSEPGDQPHDAS